jgi:hypothetical protein
MGTVNISGLEPGMVITVDVKDRLGRVLLGAGKEITEKHIRLFKMWGVTEAEVKGVAQDDVAAREAAAFDPEQVQAAEQMTRDLFVHAGQEHPAMKELARLAILRRMRSIPEKNNGE